MRVTKNRSVKIVQVWYSTDAPYVVCHMLADTEWSYTLLNMVEKLHTHAPYARRGSVEKVD
jgi:hypothetical protein